MYGDEKRSKLILYTAIFAALIAVGGWVSVPLLAIPFTLQTLFILLAAAIMKEKAVLPVLLYVATGLCGLPVFHNGSAGIGVLLGPTGGYLIGFIVAAYVAGLLFAKQMDALAVISAILIYDTTAVFWFMLTAAASLPAAVAACVLPFLIGDAIKGVLAVLIAKRFGRLGND